MSSEQITGHLEDGGTYRATGYLVEVSNPQGQVVATYDINDIRAVRRSGQEVTLELYRGGNVRLVGATLDDAGRLQEKVAESLPTQPAPTPPPPQQPQVTQTVSLDDRGRGRSSAAVVIIGIVILVIVVIIAFVLIRAVLDNDDSGGVPTATPEERPTERPTESPTEPAAPTDTPSASVDVPRAEYRLVIAGQSTEIYL